MLQAEENDERVTASNENSAIQSSISEAGHVTSPQRQVSPDNYQKPAPSSPNTHHSNRKLHFNMTSKIQIIPNNRQGQLNTTFLATVPGVMKIAEIVLAFISFILAICSDRNVTTAAWTEHISFEATVIISGLLLGYVCFPHLTLKDEPTREGLIVVELIYYMVHTLLFFIAIWLMVQLSASWNAYGRGAAIIDAILCVALTILFAIETVMKLRAWRGENTPTSRIVQSSLPTDVNKQIHELRRDETAEVV